MTPRKTPALALALWLLGAAAAPAQETTGPTFCTMDAKLCPDGSYVSRTGPNCEFAPCPGESPAPSPSPGPGSPPRRDVVPPGPPLQPVTPPSALPVPPSAMPVLPPKLPPPGP